MPVEQAIAELQREASRQFDPDLVEAFVAVLERVDPFTAGERLRMGSMATLRGTRLS